MGAVYFPLGTLPPPPIFLEAYFPIFLNLNALTGIPFRPVLWEDCLRLALVRGVIFRAQLGSGFLDLFLSPDFQPLGADGLKAALRATNKAMKNFALTLLSSCAKHHIEKNGTIWRVADKFGWKLDRFNLPPGAAARSRKPGVIQQVAQQLETSCADRLRVSERKATERVASAEKEAERWKSLVKKWKKTASDRQIEVCSVKQVNENLMAEIGAPAPSIVWFLSKSEP